MNDQKKTYSIQYTDSSDPSCPVFSYHTKAYNEEHAEMKFYDGTDSDGWKIVKISEK